MKRMLILAVVLAVALAGCVTRTGRVGKPIAERYGERLAQLKVGESTVFDLRQVMVNEKVSQAEVRIENGKRVEIWELARGGNMDAGAFLVWGVMAYDKDQSMRFRFEDGKLVSFESVVHPDPVKK
jgi:hypothetical protein